MKDFICAATGMIGAALAAAFGGWTTAMVTLVIFMGVDYLTGLIVAGIFHRSEKTPNGGLESRAGWKGLVRKGVTLLVVLVAYRLDLLLDVSYIKDAVIIAFCANEAISILENASLMGIPMLPPLQKAIELLRAKAEPEPVDAGVDYKTGYYNLMHELREVRSENAQLKNANAEGNEGAITILTAAGNEDGESYD